MVQAGNDSSTQRPDAAPGTARRAGGAGSPRRRGWVLAAAVLVVAALVAWLVVGRDDPSEDGPGGTSEAGPPRPGWEGAMVGVFRSTNAEEVEAYEAWLGRPLDLVVDIPARANWFDISAPDYLLEEWQQAGRRLVMGLAMLPEEVDGVSIEAGARGEYDEYFRTLGERMVAYGLEDSVLRVGWEFNLESWPWYTTDAETWIRYFQRIVDAMRSVPGQAFQFDWNVNNGNSRGMDPVDFYPGDDYVDYVGVDAYDVAGSVYPVPSGCTGDCAQDYHQRAWDDVVYGGDRGLRFWSEFAASRGKLLSLPEWGVWERFDGTGGGDNPFYIEQMARFIADPANAVGYQAYFEDDNSQGSHRLMGGEFPRSTERYLELFGG
ncbi:glycoside hydrolase family 26 protein [Trujillonella humicola]|uniref:glycoside hydrolase family 26 protein n=1 Tax=Trujillonella humicola TaxID=3383699 RepID=UPI003905E315